MKFCSTYFTVLWSLGTTIVFSMSCVCKGCQSWRVYCVTVILTQVSLSQDGWLFTIATWTTIQRASMLYTPALPLYTRLVLCQLNCLNHSLPRFVTSSQSLHENKHCCNWWNPHSLHNLVFVLSLYFVTCSDEYFSLLLLQVSGCCSSVFLSLPFV